MLEDKRFIVITRRLESDSGFGTCVDDEGLGEFLTREMAENYCRELTEEGVKAYIAEIVAEGSFGGYELKPFGLPF